MHVDAIHYFSKAIELNGKCDVAYYGRAQSFLATDLLDKAILDLQQTIELQPLTACLLQTLPCICQT